MKTDKTRWLVTKVTFGVAVVQIILWAAILWSTGCGTQDPFGRDETDETVAGESTPVEDAEAIVTYTQTVNQVSTSSDTTIAPTFTGDNNQVTIILGDGNVPSSENSHDQLPPVSEGG